MKRAVPVIAGRGVSGFRLRDVDALEFTDPDFCLEHGQAPDFLPDAASLSGL